MRERVLPGAVIAGVDSSDIGARPFRWLGRWKSSRVEPSQPGSQRDDANS